MPEKCSISQRENIGRDQRMDGLMTEVFYELGVVVVAVIVALRQELDGIPRYSYESHLLPCEIICRDNISVSANLLQSYPPY